MTAFRTTGGILLSQRLLAWNRLALLCLITAAPGCLSTHRLGITDPSPATSGLAGLAVENQATGHPAGGTRDLGQLPPAELNKVSLPAYRIEPPDVLLLQAIRVAPKAPYFIEYQDLVQIVASGALPDQPIAAVYQVDANGQVDLGPSYGVVMIRGLTLDEAADAISRQLQSILQNSEVSVTLIQPAGQQVISGEHLVAPDGTINLGIYGSVYVAGLTVDDARRAIEDHLASDFDTPSVSVEVFAYQSKVFYVISEGPGESVFSLPVTGSQTVLDAIATVGGLGQASSYRIWISRPAPPGGGCDQILPVDWTAITQGGDASTNYQILPGDRVFIAAYRLALLDEMVTRLLNPFERIFGFSLLGGQTVQVLQRFPGGFFF